ncbi:MAG TPA: FAD-binding oxidoreductase [Chitinophagaceae bacterium]|nr:FAD-binding oxidoreductase [Chitinophagaceae bacterium]
MNLNSGYPFWLIKDGLPHTFPKLDSDKTADVVIIGAGISGALVRYFLLRAGVSCITLDARTIGLGSTSASTSLLQYEIDTPLHELIAKVGKLQAERAYHLCNEAISTLEDLAAALGFEEFESRDSLYFAAYKKDTAFLQREFDARKAAGFDVSLLDEVAVRQQYGFDAAAGILSKHGAQTNAYAFTHHLLQYKKGKHLDIYDRTTVVKTEQQWGGVVLHTEPGFTVKAKKVIYATGYEVVEMIDKKIVDLQSTYAVVSEQYASRTLFWKDEALLWNTADPYLYLRTTHDGRIIAGGRDEPFHQHTKRDKLIPQKAKQLAADVNKLFPGIGFKTEFTWTGTFGATKDGLPYIGVYDKMPNAFFALGFGGNGITFSVVAAQIITDLVQGKKNKDAPIFAFDR